MRREISAGGCTLTSDLSPKFEGTQCSLAHTGPPAHERSGGSWYHQWAPSVRTSRSQDLRHPLSSPRRELLACVPFH